MSSAAQGDVAFSTKADVKILQLLGNLPLFWLWLHNFAEAL